METVAHASHDDVGEINDPNHAIVNTREEEDTINNMRDPKDIEHQPHQAYWATWVTFYGQNRDMLALAIQILFPIWPKYFATAWNLQNWSFTESSVQSHEQKSVIHLSFSDCCHRNPNTDQNHLQDFLYSLLSREILLQFLICRVKNSCILLLVAGKVDK